jgi:hypothetical protein
MRAGPCYAKVRREHRRILHLCYAPTAIIPAEIGQKAEQMMREAKPPCLLKFPLAAAPDCLKD